LQQRPDCFRRYQHICDTQLVLFFCSNDLTGFGDINIYAILNSFFCSNDLTGFGDINRSAILNSLFFCSNDLTGFGDINISAILKSLFFAATTSLVSAISTNLRYSTRFIFLQQRPDWFRRYQQICDTQLIIFLQQRPDWFWRYQHICDTQVAIFCSNDLTGFGDINKSAIHNSFYFFAATT
jgi:hypothetical protein